MLFLLLFIIAILIIVTNHILPGRRGIDGLIDVSKCIKRSSLKEGAFKVEDERLKGTPEKILRDGVKEPFSNTGLRFQEGEGCVWHRVSWSDVVYRGKEPR